LKGAIAIILSKLESNLGNFGVNVPNTGQVPVNVGIQNPIKEDDISNDLVKDLNSKSLEELIYIYYNEEDYVFEFTNKLRDNNLKAIQEIDALSGKLDNKNRTE
jgi:hypothetical protein